MPYTEFLFNEQFAFAVVAAILSGIVRGFSGFGAGLVMTPLLALIYGPLDALSIMMVTVMVGSLHMVPGIMPYVMKRDLVPITIDLMVRSAANVFHELVYSLCCLVLNPNGLEVFDFLGDGTLVRQ